VGDFWALGSRAWESSMSTRAASGAAARIQSVRRQARGRWRSLFASFGIDEASLSHPNQTCPICGSPGRFSLTDTCAEGTYVCRSCGRGDGLDLIARTTGLGLMRTVRAVEWVMRTGENPIRSGENRGRGRYFGRAISAIG
jgi:phage/plasmid primase-like uncharacterized protein